jgi:hypothetical protein
LSDDEVDGTEDSRKELQFSNTLADYSSAMIHISLIILKENETKEKRKQERFIMHLLVTILL